MKEKIKNIKKMIQVQGYKKWFVLLFSIIIGTQILEVYVTPKLITKIFDYHIPNSNIVGVIVVCITYTLFLFLTCYTTLKHVMIRCWLQRWIQRDLKNKIFEKLQYVKKEFYDKNTTGTILQFLNDDSYNASRLFSIISTEMFVMGLGRFFIIVLFLLFVDIKLTIIVLIIYIIGASITIYSNRSTIGRIIELRKINTDIYTYINECINGVVTIKTLNIIKYKEEELEEKLNKYNQEKMQLEKRLSLYKNLFALIVSLVDILIVVIGGMNVIEGIFTYAQIILFIEYSGELSYEFNWFIRNISNYNKSYIAFYKALEFLEKDNTEDINKGKKLTNINSISFKDVTFRYGQERSIISNISFDVKENESIAIVGKTGSGKSTITNLICRLYEPTSGEILINDTDYLKYNIKSIRSKIGYILQDIDILPNTILDNIKYVKKDISIQQVEEIFKRLNLHDKIMTFKDGYNTDIYNNPDLLSQGEKQIINFARIMALDADLIIMDEITSYLSVENENMIRQAIKEVTKNKMSIIIAHRLPTIKECDKILLLDNGEILERGTHKELIKKEGKYYKLYSSNVL